MDVRVYTINHLRTRHGYNSRFFLTPSIFQISLHLTNIKNSFNQERLTTEYTAQQSRPSGGYLFGQDKNVSFTHKIRVFGCYQFFSIIQPLLSFTCTKRLCKKREKLFGSVPC